MIIDTIPVVLHWLCMSEIFNMTGLRFGKLVGVKKVGNHPKSRRAMWLFQCDCGKTKVIAGGPVRSGNSRSCGCGIVNATIQRNLTHGLSFTPEHMAWREMKKRCYNPNYNGFKNYGGRGISVCERWMDSFENFFSDMGKRPSEKHSIDRVENNGNYEPGNCRWATKKHQNRNKRNNHKLCFSGESKTIQEWSEITGINHGTIESRIRKSKWTVEKSLTVIPKC